MKYIVFPVEQLNEIPQDVLDNLHLSPRKSVDGTEVIMKVVNYEQIFPVPMTLEQTEVGEVQVPHYPYPLYEGDALTTLLNSSKWTEPEQLPQSGSVLGEEVTPVTTKKNSKSTVLS